MFGKKKDKFGIRDVKSIQSKGYSTITPTARRSLNLISFSTEFIRGPPDSFEYLDNPGSLSRISGIFFIEFYQFKVCGIGGTKYIYPFTVIDLSTNFYIVNSSRILTT